MLKRILAAACISLFLSTPVIAEEVQTNKITFPAVSDILKTFGQCTTNSIPNTFEILVWNVQKGKQGHLWANDFESLLYTNDITLMQEGMLNPFMSNVFNKYKEYCWNFAVSFFDNQDATGVVTGSVYKPTHSSFFKSPYTEPILFTPKMATITRYPLSNSQNDLLVVNIHALNFTRDEYQKMQLEGLAQIIRKHVGPVIFAGDFNNWSTGRQKNLHAITKSLGLSVVSFPNDTRSRKIDHIYFKDLKIKTSKVHMGISSADHKPLTAIFSVE